jgi:hypothetical protein
MNHGRKTVLPAARVRPRKLRRFKFFIAPRRVKKVWQQFQLRTTANQRGNSCFYLTQPVIAIATEERVF